MNEFILDSKHLSILGTGAWATTLACQQSENFEKVLMWDYKPARAQQAQIKRKFEKPLSGTYPRNIEISSDLKHTISSSIIVLVACPIKSLDQLYMQLSNYLEAESLAQKVFVNCAKGIDTKNFLCPSEIAYKYFQKINLANLSGPNLAIEVLAKKPMISTIAANNKELTTKLKTSLSTVDFRLYESDDLIGSEICGAFKNVIAIAAGAARGLGMGDSTLASLITRALNENLKLLKLKGGKLETINQACGIGDLIATCNSTLSRNFQVGYRLAQGNTLEQIKSDLNASTEGVYTVRAIDDFAEKNNLDMPITKQVRLYIDQKINAQQIANSLMNRS